MSKKIMDVCAMQARRTMSQGNGGPFGAIIIKDGGVLALASNTVLEKHDPTAHAEMNAIRIATKKLETHDLKGCELYTTGYPCPMCISAAIWANIDKIYYCNSLEDAEAIGFRDDMIYKWFEEHDTEILDIKHVESEEASTLYKEYADRNGMIY